MEFADTFSRTCAYKEIAVALKRQLNRGDRVITPAVFYAGEQVSLSSFYFERTGIYAPFLCRGIRNHIMTKQIFVEMAMTGVLDKGLIIADRNYSLICSVPTFLLLN
jgi:hypothetical protein